ncbi:MAG: 2-aminoethylphosphonate-pyruvate transaminase [Gammaproteobacteria bacterium]|jgi:2-aminoethylphosphonate-pyruvate transaminase
MKTILLNPGPVTLSERVRQSLLGDDLCHREIEFTSLQSDIRNKLLSIYRLADADWAATLMTGSGTAAVEAMVTSLIPETGKLLIIENGVYGERMTRIAERYGIATQTLRNNWEAPIDYAAVERALEADSAISHVAVVHHETTTGRLNELAPLATLCRQHGAAILLDAVSSFGAETIDFANWPIAACAATANKCLHGVPGTCFVVVNRDSLANAHPRGVYLDLVAYVAAQDKAGTPFTQSVQTFYALDEALNELIEQGGVECRRQTYRSRMGQIRSLLIELDVKPFLKDDEVSCVLHAYEIPSTTNYVKLHDDLKAQGFVIYAGQGPYAENMFRISMMGEISDSDVERLGRALKVALQA